ncbi:MAG: tRNA (adenosine(37)-N6)-threonylcarbamoyltransferase complex dimerization subunit type 1 TsaB [Candidatus Fermentibacteria bacterium]|nr:tRNA (adenosine(37)-N6)-threonylcarbamoyltransferase complex dimerization subunit type 1 TsaB [Candidatus Fermentibacteria bacterium]
MIGIWLGIDTTSSVGSVALLKDGLLLTESILPVTGFHSEKILPAVKKAMKESGVSGCDLSGIGVSLGPGSYTGLRIGLATVLGLASGWEVPVKGVSTLRVIAAALPEGPVFASVRARNGEVFAGAFSSPDPLSQEILPQSLYSSQVLEELLSERIFSAAGSGRSEISSPGLRWVHPVMDLPRASFAAFCACTLAEKDGFDRDIEPLYLRKFNQRISPK